MARLESSLPHSQRFKTALGIFLSVRLKNRSDLPRNEVQQTRRLRFSPTSSLNAAICCGLRLWVVPPTSEVPASRRHTWQGIATAQSHFRRNTAKRGPCKLLKTAREFAIPSKGVLCGFARGQCSPLSALAKRPAASVPARPNRSARYGRRPSPAAQLTTGEDPWLSLSKDKDTIPSSLGASAVAPYWSGATSGCLPRTGRLHTLQRNTSTS
jgi:hypothetical protein